jgi:[protein-PII] uridylyltransferase
VAKDKPGLLASIAGALAANRLDVMTAHVYSRACNTDAGGTEAVDLFAVRRANRDGDEAIEPLTDKELARIGDDLERVVSGEVDPSALLHERRGSAANWREKPSPAVATDVEIDDRASRRFTVIDVYAKDRPGLLFTIARALHELRLSIARSKIATEGARAADSFYVTEIDGAKVDARRASEIQRTIVEAIERLAREGIA